MAIVGCSDSSNHCRVLVEVNKLSSENGVLQWEPVLESLVPLSVHYIQVLSIDH